MEGSRLAPPFRAWLALPVVALGFSLRVSDLTANSFWLDEGFSWSLSHAPVLYILRQCFTREPNPPGYFLALHGWAQLAGFGEFSLRYLSVMAGVLTLPLLYVLGARLVNRWAGLAAALLAAVNPFLVWYSQEARMYSLLALLGAASTLALLRLLARPTRSRWTAYVAWAVAALYAHLFATLTLAAHVAFVAWVERPARRGPRSHQAEAGQSPHLPAPPDERSCRGAGCQPARSAVRRRWALSAMAASLLLYTPWLVAIPGLPQGALAWRPLLGLPDVVVLSLRNFTTFTRLPGGLDGPAAALWALLAALGVAAALARGARAWSPLGRVRGSSAAALLLAWFFVPLALVYLASFKEPLYAPRYLIVATPPLLLAASAGLAALRAGRRALGGASGRWVGTAGLTLLTGLSLLATWRASDYPKEDYRSAAEFVLLRSQPGDTVFFEPPYLEYPFEYYYEFRNGGPAELLPLGGPGQDVGVALAAAVPRSGTIWLVNAGHTALVDPHEQAIAWLSARFPRSADLYLPGVHLLQFSVRYLADALPAGATPAHLTFGAGLALKGFQPRPAPGRPGAWDVALYWQAEQRLEQDYHVSLQVFDAAGRKVAQVDGEPLGAGFPTSRFPPGRIVLDDHVLRLPRGAPPGRYAVRLAVYPPGGAPVPANSPDWPGERRQVGLADLTLEQPAA